MCAYEETEKTAFDRSGQHQSWFPRHLDLAEPRRIVCYERYGFSLRTRENEYELVPHSLHAFSIIVKRDPLTAADYKAACTDIASDPLTRPLTGSVAPDSQPKHDDGEVISMLHRTLLAIHGCK